MRWFEFFLIFLTLFTFISIASSQELLEVHSFRPTQAESTLEALIPWETPIEGFFIRSHHGLPAVSEKNWSLTIDGLVKKPIKITLSKLRKLPQQSFHAVLECSGNGRSFQSPNAPGVPWKKGAVGNAEWTGVRLKDIISRTIVHPKAKYVTLYGADRPAMRNTPPFIRSVPIEKIFEDTTLLALQMNREKLPLVHGGPLRLILPGWYAENWTKWLTRITFTETEDSGFFMKKAYRMPKSPIQPGGFWDPSKGVTMETMPVQSFMLKPRSNEEFSVGKILVQGKTFSGTGPIVKLELSSDQGKTWKASQLQTANHSGGWQEFRDSLEINTPGTYRIWSRATDLAGNIQPSELKWNPGGYARNSVDEVQISVKDHPKDINRGLPVLKNKCLTCHTEGLIQSQRLTSNQWENELKKMETLGDVLNAEEKTLILDYLNFHFNPEANLRSSHLTNYDKLKTEIEGLPSLPKGNWKRGKKLFLKHCTNCHGTQAEGNLGPRLAGRVIPNFLFWSTVMTGKGIMPPFEKLLKKSEIADVQSFIQNLEVKDKFLSVN